MADTALDLPDVPVPVDKAFEGKQLLSAFILSRSPSIGFKGAVGFLQQKLLDDQQLDCAST